MSWLSDIISKVTKKAKETAGNAVQGAQNAVGQIGTAIGSAAQNVVQNVSDGYGDWLNGAEQTVGDVKDAVSGAVQQGTQIAGNVVSQGTQYVKDATGKVIEQAQPQVENAVQQGTQAVGQVGTKIGDAVSGALDTVGNAVGEVSQNVTNAVNDVNGKVQNVVGGETTQSETPAQQPAVPSTTQPAAQPTEPSVTPEIDDEPIDTYEQFLAHKAENLGAIKDKTTTAIDNQNAETLAAIQKKKESADAHATDVKETTDAAINAQKDSTYKQADDTLASELGYNEEAFNTLVNSITEQYKAGKISLEDAKALLISMAEEQKGLTYEAAERRRAEEEKEADIARQRAIVDANSGYEQNKAGYGANAEAMAKMGLTGGGYSDWLNASAYAQQRAETQAARAQSETAKRQARYTEDQTKLTADSEYNSKKYSAESDYLDKMYELDTSYRTNMSNAEQEKLRADQEAKTKAANTKNEADDAARAGLLESDLTYKTNMFQNDATAKEDTLTANQAAASGKLGAEISYLEGIMDNDEALAKYKKELEAGTADAEAKKTAIYSELLVGVNNGTYTSEQISSLCDALGMSEEQKQTLLNSANTYEGKVSDAEDKANAEVTSQRYTSLLTGAANGTFNETTVKALAKEYGLSTEQTDEIIKAAQGYATEKGEAVKLDEATQAGKTFVGLLDSIASGAFDGYSAEQIAQIAGELGLTLTDGQKGLVDQAMKNYSGNVGEADADYKNGVYMELLSGAKNGAYTEAEIADFVTRYGLDEGMAKNLAQAVTDYNTKVSDAKNKSEAQQKTANFLDLLARANSGELTKEELTQVAKELGFDETADETQLDLLSAAADRFATGTAEDKAAAKNMSFISLLDGANTGAYTSAQIGEMAKMFGFDLENEDDAKLIGMLTQAADDYAAGEVGKTAKADKEYQNGIYAELLTAANNGDFTEEQIRDLANRFGIDDPDDILGKAARDAAEKVKDGEKQNSAAAIIDLKDRGYITSDITDEEIEDYVDAGLISEDDIEKVKEERTQMGIKEIDDMIKGGDYDGAIKRAEELYAEGTGTIDVDTYQKAYFEGQKNNCAQVANVNKEKGETVIDNIKTCEADLNNALAAGQISQADYDSLVDYMYQSVGGVLEKGSYTADVKSEYDFWGSFVGMASGDMTSKDKLTLTLSIGEVDYEYNLRNCSSADSDTARILDSIFAGSPEGCSLVMFEDKLYIHSSLGWRNIPNKNKLYEEYNKQVGYQPKVTAPKHTSNENSSGGVSRGGGGSSGGVLSGVGNHSSNVAHTLK